jgi:hypothetical protein
MRNSLRHISSFVILAILFGCRPDAGTHAPAKDSSLPMVTTPQPWTPTATGTATNSGMAASPTNFKTRTLPPTRTSLPTETKTTHPTHIPTPTRGLPPTFTLSPKEECPPPTYIKVDIQFSEDIWDYGPQILEYFRAYGDRADLGAQLEEAGGNAPNIAQFTEADVTGDQIKETIITLKQSSTIGPSWTIDMAVFVIGCRDHKYQWLNQYSKNVFSGEEQYTQLEDIRDLNGNGLLEIIVRSGSTFSQQADVRYYYDVIEWGGKSFHTLLALNWEGNMGPPLEFQDIDGNGTTELLFSDSMIIHCGWGPQRNAKHIFMWNGEQYQYMWTDPGKPEFRFQAAFDGDYFALRGLFDKSETRYRKALNDPSLKPFTNENYHVCYNPGDFDPDESQKITVYARFRLMELEVFLGKLGAAETDWRYLTTQYEESAPGYNFVLLADAFWEAYQAGKNIDDACSAVRAAAEQNEPSDFGLMDYGALNPRPTVDTICPFHSGTGEQ